MGVGVGARMAMEASLDLLQSRREQKDSISQSASTASGTDEPEAKLSRPFVWDKVAEENSLL